MFLLLTCTLVLLTVNFIYFFSLILPFLFLYFGFQEKKSLYASPEEFQSLIKQVLSWDIRSLSQRNRPHDYSIEKRNGKALVNNTSDSLTQEKNTCDSDGCQDEEASIPISGQVSLSSGDNIIYHLNLEGLNVSYRIDCKGNVIVEKIAMSSDISNSH